MLNFNETLALKWIFSKRFSYNSHSNFHYITFCRWTFVSFHSICLTLYPAVYRPLEKLPNNKWMNGKKRQTPLIYPSTLGVFNLHPILKQTEYKLKACLISRNWVDQTRKKNWSEKKSKCPATAFFKCSLSFFGLVSHNGYWGRSVPGQVVLGSEFVE